MNGLPQLQSLDISECGKITDEGITALANECPQLQSLDISHCDITDEGIIALLNGLPQLQFLDISECGFTDEGIRALANRLLINYLHLDFKIPMIINNNACNIHQDSKLM